MIEISRELCKKWRKRPFISFADPPVVLFLLYNFVIVIQLSRISNRKEKKEYPICLVCDEVGCCKINFFFFLKELGEKTQFFSLVWREFSFFWCRLCLHRLSKHLSVYLSISAVASLQSISKRRSPSIFVFPFRVCRRVCCITGQSPGIESSFGSSWRQYRNQVRRDGIANTSDCLAATRTGLGPVGRRRAQSLPWWSPLH